MKTLQDVDGPGFTVPPRTHALSGMDVQGTMHSSSTGRLASVAAF